MGFICACLLYAITELLLLRLRERHNVLQLPVFFFFFSFFCRSYPGLRNCKSVIPYFKYLPIWWIEASVFSFFQGIHIRIDKRIDIFISIRPMITKFGKQAHFFSISITRVTMATKPERMATYLDGLLPMKSHDPLIT